MALAARSEFFAISGLAHVVSVAMRANRGDQGAHALILPGSHLRFPSLGQLHPDDD
jgi:hypothetical protein